MISRNHFFLSFSLSLYVYRFILGVESIFYVFIYSILTGFFAFLPDIDIRITNKVREKKKKASWVSIFLFIVSLMFLRIYVYLYNFPDIKNFSYLFLILGLIFFFFVLFLIFDIKVLGLIIKILKHRGVTHSLLFLVFLGVLSHYNFLFFPIFLGVLFHIIEDMFSYRGVEVFYPFLDKRFNILKIKATKNLFFQWFIDVLSLGLIFYFLHIVN